MKVGTFFSGIGSPEQALLNLRIKHDIEFACDIDKYARQTYLKNFDCKIMYEDITTLNMKDLSYVDLLVFGFPCQAFSMAGKRGGFEDTRGTLFYDALRYLKEHKPRYFIAENVKGLISHDSGKTFQTIIDCLALTVNTQMTLMPFDNLGYHIHYKVLNTKDYGIPQNRERIFIVGIRDDADNNFRFPKEMPLKLKLEKIIQKKVKEKYFLSDKLYKIINKKHNNIKGCALRTYPRTKNVDQDKKIGRTKRLELRNEDVANSINTHEYDSILWVADYRNDEGLRKRKDKTTPCLTASKNSENELSRMPPILKQDKIRRLTPIECERLQGFPDNHTEGVSDTQRYKQCGNSITVNVMEAILKNLLNGHS